ncbi:acylneuraminate cytidylyltransferase [Rhodococcus ruber]|uniref:acylneuraminate cytidylyltransferase n=1 Tax=Rhodococcus ruber TaxID=1830 RepID=UPI001F355BB5|nr:acylneuraminate cytidylyltransferase [Rhodococcus ruber]MCF8781345.1 acylneuraminate cytidylyltransferase [Rhodococcus ruber]
MSKNHDGAYSDGRGATAIIPARGGSKGVRRKNLRRIEGRELVARAIDACRDATNIQLVVVTTDDGEIAELAANAGADVVMRPSDLASDSASSESALLHALDVLQKRYGELAATTVFVQCTSPLIRPADLDGAIAKLESTKADTVLSVVESHRFVWRENGGCLTGVNHSGGPRMRRQDLAPEFTETGAFYVLRTEKFRSRGERFMDRTVGFEVPLWTSVEIDTEEDLEIAAALARLGPRHDRRFSEISAVVTDFDGVHTNDLAYVDEAGREHVRVSRSDGMGIGMLRDAGFPILILSKEVNSVVSHRAKKLRVDVCQGVDDKLPVMQQWLARNRINPRRAAYIGNDINDSSCMAYVGWPIAVADANPEILRVARHVLTRRGGQGALREFSDLLLSSSSRQVRLGDEDVAAPG